MAKEQGSRNHGGEVQEFKNWRHDPPRYWKGTGHRSRPTGVRSGLRNGGGRKKPRRANSQGLTGTLEMLRSAKGGRPDGGRGG